MKAVILLAGLGTRLRPHTSRKPKALLPVAGKTVLGHILDGLKDLDISEYIFVHGYHFGDQVKFFVEQHYSHLNAKFVEQEKPKGQSHAVQLAREHINEPVLVIFGDTIWEADLSRLKNVTSDGRIYVKEVDNPRRFGIAFLRNGYAIKLIEKPQNPESNLAIVGVYYFRDWKRLLSAIDEQITKNVMTNNEYFLTDAVQIMIDHGARMEVETIPVWEDCGTPNALLETNRYLLSKNGSKAKEFPGSVILPPVNISDNACIVNSIVGPNVSISEDTTIKNSIIRDSIIGEGAYIENHVLEKSLVGDYARDRRAFEILNIGASDTDTEANGKNGN